MTKHYIHFSIGSAVDATPKNGDFSHEFRGTVIGYKGEYIQVQDQDGDVFDCELYQLELVDDE